MTFINVLTKPGFWLMLVSLMHFWSQPALAGEAFSPSGCGYEVTFPEAPETYEKHVTTAADELILLQGAQLITEKELFRAECGSAQGRSLAQFTASNMLTYMQQISRNYGLKHTNYETREADLGMTGTLTGFKESQRGRVTVRIRNIVGNDSILTLTVSALAKDFQTPAMAAFMRSTQAK